MLLNKLLQFLFFILVLIHILIWVFVLFAFLKKKTAIINIKYVIPIIYIIHIFPFHFINKLKKKIYPNNCKSENNKILKILVIPYLFVKLQEKFEDFSFASPITPQGMLIFGLLTSINKLI
tara:strand:+ start:65 stop:427 length:363 start_codon:yes stop_codon:yes gene_type:complete